MTYHLSGTFSLPLLATAFDSEAAAFDASQAEMTTTVERPSGTDHVFLIAYCPARCAEENVTYCNGHVVGMIHDRGTAA